MGLSLVEMARRRALGKNIILETAQEYKISVETILRSPRTRALQDIRRLLVKRFREAGIGTVIGARLLRVDPTTITYHRQGILSAKARYRRERAAARAMEML